MGTGVYMPNAMLLSDYYKQGHPEFYPDKLEYLATFGTARLSRIIGLDKIVIFGLQGFVKDYLIDRFNETFFNKSKELAVSEVQEFIGQTFNCPSFDIHRIEALHDLGYLPVRMWTVPEGMILPIYNQKDNPDVTQVPFMMYESTNPDFSWVAEFLESITSCQIWYSIVIATITKFGYRKIVDKHWEKSVVGQPACTAISEFGFRGAESSEGAVQASSSFLTSFNKTATCPAILYLKHFYGSNDNGENVSLSEIGGGMSSTEHSVMCSNYAVDGDEETFLLRLFDEIAPSGNLSIVSDSYNYWGLLDKIANTPELIEGILRRKNGAVYIRGDSGNPVEIVCGTYRGLGGETLEEKGTVEVLWDIFGGMVNSKGYKVLDSHIRVIYGDSITPRRAEEIYSRLEEKGFAANNVALGAGSLSMQSWESGVDKETGKLILLPYTRDTFGIAFKATYCEVAGKEYQIYKDPKTDKGSFKKSQRGMVVVYQDQESGKIKAKDHLNREQFIYESNMGNNLLRPIFENGKLLVEDNIRDIRNRLHTNF